MDSLDTGDPLSYSFLQLLQNTSNLLRIEYIAAVSACFILLLLSALTSGAEAAFFSLSEQELDKYKTSKTPIHQTIYGLLKKPRKLLSTFLIINNGINVSIITLFAFISWQLFDSTSIPTLTLTGYILAATFFIVFFGEVLPKVYAQKHALVLMERTAHLVRVMQRLASPLSWLLLSISGFFEKRYMARAYNYTMMDLHHSLDVALNNEDTTPEERKILRGVVNFGAITVKQIMRPRRDIIAFNTQLTLPELMPRIVKWGYSRIPVYSESTDKIEGILYIKDLLPHLDKEADFNWQKLVRQPFFVPETKRISDLFKDFKAKHVHMAIVLNEYGTTVGLLTLEDVVEEIVGEINDEYDDEDIFYSQLDENTYIFDGKTSLHDFCKVTEDRFDIFDEVKGENETVAGLMLELFSRIPRAGEAIDYKHFHFTVESADKKRVKRVKINVTSKKENHHKVSN